MTHRNTGKKWIAALGIVIGFTGLVFSKPPSSSPVNPVSTRYILKWTGFYPTEAFAMGHRPSAFHFEHFSGSRVSDWIRFNREILSRLNSLDPLKDFDDRMDARLLKRKIRIELDKWETDGILRSSPTLYSELISQALTHVLVSTHLTPREKGRSISRRLKGIQRLCGLARQNLSGGSPSSIAEAIGTLKSTAEFYRNGLPAILFTRGISENPPEAKKTCAQTGEAVLGLMAHMEALQSPASEKSDFLGRDIYARKLKLITGLEITPEQLEMLALEEIHRVRSLMSRWGEKYWRKTYPREPLPRDFPSLMEKVLKDMESHRVNSQADFLAQFRSLINRAESFVREKRLAPLPGRRTLRVDLSPAHFSGATVGGVYPAGPFNADWDTLFYLPAIPDDAPEPSRTDFYRSFNTHFNTMIITHEIFPGHYLQLKTAAHHPRMVRSLFGGDQYAEGWATLCEQITLDRGWDDNHPLTRMAHYRKRLENAVRAYASTQVHCRGWNRDRLIDFAVTTGLLAPQFAVNLWQRVIRSPFQLTSYFLGYRAFQKVLEKQKEEKGRRFSFFDFSKTILAAGSVPVDALYTLFDNRK